MFNAIPQRPLPLIPSWKRLGMVGQTASLISPLVLLAFSMPWFSSPDFSRLIDEHFLASTSSGWVTAARGLSGFAGTDVILFPHLWLIPISAVILLGTSWLLSQGKLSQPVAVTIFFASYLLIPLIALGFLIQITSLESHVSRPGVGQGEDAFPNPAYSVSWGFWLTIALCGMALFLSFYALRQRQRLPDDVEASTC
jgi:hypothetical protein